eukprot:scaffold2544_cov245-Pinguiococcus_pyrenoidosus.AAC.4
MSCIVIILYVCRHRRGLPGNRSVFDDFARSAVSPSPERKALGAEASERRRMWPALATFEQNSVDDERMRPFSLAPKADDDAEGG